MEKLQILDVYELLMVILKDGYNKKNLCYDCLQAFKAIKNYCRLRATLKKQTVKTCEWPVSDTVQYHFNQIKGIYVSTGCRMLLVFTYIVSLTYILNTKFSNGVVHQYSEVLHRHPDIPVHPAAFFWPILKTFVLFRELQQRGR